MFSRRLLPAMVAGLVHALLLAGFLQLRPKPAPLPSETVLPTVFIARPASPPAPLGAPGQGLSLPAPAIPLAVPDQAITIAPEIVLPPMLGEYLGCGVSAALTDDERARCDGIRSALYAKPDVKPDHATDAALERRFARAKEFEDAPKTLPCFPPTPLTPFCLIGGAVGIIELKPGAYVQNRPPGNPLAAPVFPYHMK